MINFDALFNLDHRIAVYVPGTIHDKPAKDLQEAKTTDIIKQMSVMFGGCTVNHVLGGWYSDELNKTITEMVNICYSYCTADQIETHAGNVVDICRDLCRDMQQEAVTLEYDGKITFITL